MGVSFVISAGLFVGIVAALAAAIATARVVVKRKQKEVDVSFAQLPRAPKPRPVVKAQPGKRKLAQRQALRAPTAIPQQQPPRPRGSWPRRGTLVRSKGSRTALPTARAGGRSRRSRPSSSPASSTAAGPRRSPRPAQQRRHHRDRRAHADRRVRSGDDGDAAHQTSADSGRPHPRVRPGPGLQAGPPARRHRRPLPVPPAVRVQATGESEERKGTCIST
jgi:hypothetical protein